MLTEGRTFFVIAHQRSTIKNANLILVIKDGSITESGSHKVLMKKATAMQNCIAASLSKHRKRLPWRFMNHNKSVFYFALEFYDDQPCC